MLHRRDAVVTRVRRAGRYVCGGRGGGSGCGRLGSFHLLFGDVPRIDGGLCLHVDAHDLLVDGGVFVHALVYAVGLGMA